MKQLPYRDLARVEKLHAMLQKRVLITDGAMGTMIQAVGLDEEDFRGELFAGHAIALHVNNDLLSLT
ncbi:MAG: homocysteine S-methyltransferase family protein, partial [Lysobacterales bacterium]